MPGEINKEDYGRNLASWTFPEYVKYKRTLGWYLWMGVIAGGILLYCVWTSNFLLAVIIVMLVVIVLAHNFAEPSKVTFTIFEDGLLISKNFYPWSDLRNFWIVYEPPEVRTLYFDRRSLRPTLSIDLADQNPVEVREILLRVLKEDLSHEGELLGDGLSRWLKI